MRAALELCKDFNSLNHPKFSLNQRPIQAKIKILSERFIQDEKEKGFEQGRAKYQEALHFLSMLRDDDPPNEQYLKRPSTQELV